MAQRKVFLLLPPLFGPSTQPPPYLMISKYLSDMHSEPRFRKVNCTLIASVSRGTYVITCDSEAWGQATNSSAPSVPPEPSHPAPPSFYSPWHHTSTAVSPSGPRLLDAPCGQPSAFCPCPWTKLGSRAGGVGLGGRTDFVVLAEESMGPYDAKGQVYAQRTII